MRRSRPYVQLDPAVIEQARQTDLLSYLRAYEPKVLLLPPKHRDCNRVMQCLFGRGIDYQLIQECIADGTIYESADYRNAVFVGKDKSGTPKYAALRSTLGSPFKQDASGSDKRYSFRLLAKEPINTVHLFEAAVDLLSYLQLFDPQESL